MALIGCVCKEGSGKGVVVKTGTATEIGKVINLHFK